MLGWRGLPFRDWVRGTLVAQRVARGWTPVLAALMCPVASGAVTRVAPVSGVWKRAFVCALCGLYGLYLLLSRPPGPFTAPDSAGYLAFAPIHLLGYVSFLKLVGATGATIAQPVLFAVALACLGIATLRLTSSVTLSTAIMAAAIAIPDLQSYHYSVLTESLFMSCLVAFLACVIGFVRAPSARSVARASAMASLAAIVRSPGLALLVVVPAMMLIAWRRLGVGRAAVFMAAAAPAVMIVGGERLAAHIVHGDSLTSLLGRDLFARAALIEASAPEKPAADPQQAQLEEALEARYAPVRRLLSLAAPDIRAVLTVYYETCLEGPCIEEIGTTDATVAPKAVNDILARAGLARLLRAPSGYVVLTARAYRSLWTAFRVRDPGTVPGLNAFIAQHRPLPFERLVFKVGLRDPIEFQSSGPVRLLQPVVSAIGWVTGCLALLGVAAAAARRELPQTLMVACLGSLAAHGTLLFYALFAAGIGRYMLGVWPAVTTAVLFGAWWAASGRILRFR